MSKKHNLALIWTQYTLLLYMFVVPDWKNTKFVLYKGRISVDVIRRLYKKEGHFFGGYWATYFSCLKRENIIFDGFTI